MTIQENVSYQVQYKFILVFRGYIAIYSPQFHLANQRTRGLEDRYL